MWSAMRAASDLQGDPAPVQVAQHGRPEEDVGFAASVPVVLSGRFRFPLFALALPLGILFSRVFARGQPRVLAAPIVLRDAVGVVPAPC